MKIRLEFNRHNCWIGVYWKKRRICQTPDYSGPDSTGTMIRSERLDHLQVAREAIEGLHLFEPGLVVDVWICLVPCFSIHLTWE